MRPRSWASWLRWRCRLYPGVVLALFAMAATWLRSRGAASPVALAATFAALDHLRSFALGGWPWATLGYAHHQNPAMLGLASITGVYGLSFVTVLVGAALAEAWLASRAGLVPPRGAWLALAVAAALLLLGSLQRDEPAAGEVAVLRVAALQGNIEQGAKWDAARAEEILGIYLDLADQATRAGADVVVWPESAVPGLLEADPALRARVLGAARDARVSHVVGAVGVELNAEGTGIEHYFDSAFVVGPSGRSLDRYDKSHLVPFGEYLPLRGLLGRVLVAIATGLASQDVTAGEAPRALWLPLPDRPGSDRGLPAQLKVGVPICYELLFPDGVRRFAADGGEVLFAITNDAWYGRTGAPDQFLAMTALRAAETGLWTVRAANTGISAVIDAQGWVRKQTPIFERKVLMAELPVAAGTARGSGESSPPERTFYVENGDVFAWACWAVAAVRMLRTRRDASRRIASRKESRA